MNIFIRCVATLSRPGRKAFRTLREIRRYSKALLGVDRYRDVVRFGLAKTRVHSADKSESPILLRPACMKGLQVELNGGEPTHFEIFDEIAIETVYDLSLVTFTPDLVLDCGGHIGLFTALAAGRYGDSVPVTTFEPNPENAAYVGRLIDRNALRHVRLVQAAVSTEAGSATFFRRNTVGGSLSQAADGVVDSFQVQVVDLPAMLRDRNPQRLLLKMDIEGEETRLIPALLPLLPAMTAIFFETHTASTGWDALARALREAGFDVTLLRNRDPYRDGYASRTSLKAAT